MHVQHLRGEGGAPPQPYSFSYDSTDEFGTRLTREETGDANNFKVGSYSYTDAAGITRTVKYTADAEGFHATVETNEPGTKTSNPADALYTSAAVEVAPAPAPAAPVVAKPVVAAVKPVVVQAAPAPVAVHAVHAVHPAQFAVAAGPYTYGHHFGPPPQPYSFSYDTTDEFGTRLTREETGDANNFKVGSYSYTDAAGITRTVKYTADAEGFHATVETNEPGTKTSNPADALYTSGAVEVAPAPVAAAPVVAKPVVAAVKPVVVQAAPAPVAVHAVHAVHPAQFAVAAGPYTYGHHFGPVALVHPAPFTIGKAKA
ncbi:hypothetical protein V5799_003538 [Amblyomma americanum]|uniref:Cuticle protein n=1 Tax=Amblyomma americanum TaxID=6943 RepID=A0AAQ4D8P1_AMBAM